MLSTWRHDAWRGGAGMAPSSKQNGCWHIMAVAYEKAA